MNNTDLNKTDGMILQEDGVIGASQATSEIGNGITDLLALSEQVPQK